MNAPQGTLADGAAQAGSAAAVPAAVPIWFGAPELPLFGWWHASATGPSGTHGAVLLCSPLGHEDLATHPCLRRLALHLAAAGWAVLRYDPPGSGDSADPAQPDDWPGLVQQAVHQAADELKRRSGCARLALVGLRMGSLLAARAAAERQDVDLLVGILPVASGRAWLRECRLLDGRSIGAAVVRVDPAAGVDLGGLVLGAAASQALSALGWPSSGLPPMWMIDRDDLPAGRLAAELKGTGSVVEWRTLARLDRLTAVAHLAHAPDTLYAEVLCGLVRGAGTGPMNKVTPLPDGPGLPWVNGSRQGLSVPEVQAADTAPDRLPGPLGLTVRLPAGQTVQVQESLVWLRAAPALAGVLSRAASTHGASLPRRGLLLLSSGAERRVGPNRSWVPFARARAAQGDVVLRLDLGGLGDSDARDGAALDVYDTRGAADIAEAVAWLKREQGVSECVVAGICSGAYHAWRAALAEAACSTVVAVNPLVFHWKPGMSLDPTAHAFGRAAVASDAVRSLRDPSRWLKLLRGQVDLRVIGRALAGRLGDRLAQQRRGLSRWLGQPQADDLAADLLHAVQRGVHPCFVFSEGDPGEWLLAAQGGRVYRRLRARRQIEVRHLPGADHTLSHQAAREALWRQLDELIDQGARAP